jgi:hypothetical protein
MDVGDGGTSSSQSLEPSLGLATEPVPCAVPIHSERPTEATAAVLDPLFNAAGKAPVIVKQESGWFHLLEEKWQKKTVEKLALQREK